MNKSYFQNCHFARDPAKPELVEFLDADGLPHIGARLGDFAPMAW